MRLSCAEISLEVEVLGAGEPLLIIHGFTGCGSAMAPLTKLLTGRRIIPDLIGHGRSESPVSLDPYSLTNISSQLSSLLQQLDAEPASIIGYSLGGRVALTFALSHPEMVKSLALIGASPGISNQQERDQRLVDDYEIGNSITRIGTRKFIDNWVAMPMWESLRSRLTPQQWENSIKQRRTSHPLGLANSLRASGTGAMPPLHETLDSLTVPTLLLVGEEDSKFLNIAKEMEPRISTATIEVIKNSGHATHLEQPKATADAIMKHYQCS